MHHFKCYTTQSYTVNVFLVAIFGCVVVGDLSPVKERRSIFVKRAGMNDFDWMSLQNDDDITASDVLDMFFASRRFG